MARGPERIGNILADLMARQGFARVQGAALLETAWREAAGELAARDTRVGSVRRGRLDVIVANSTLVQELCFQKPTLLQELARRVPDERINDLRFRIGAID